MKILPNKNFPLYDIEAVLGNCVGFKGFDCTHTEFTAHSHTVECTNARDSTHHEVGTNL